MTPLPFRTRPDDDQARTSPDALVPTWTGTKLARWAGRLLIVTGALLVVVASQILAPELASPADATAPPPQKPAPLSLVSQRVAGLTLKAHHADQVRARCWLVPTGDQWQAECIVAERRGDTIDAHSLLLQQHGSRCREHLSQRLEGCLAFPAWQTWIDVARTDP